MPNWSATSTVVLVATSLVACHPARLGAGRNTGDRPVHVAVPLDCPQRQGRLVRQSIEADGRACVYVGSDGRRVDLRLVAVRERDDTAALSDLEASLRAKMARDDTAEPSSSGAPGAGHVVLNLPGVHIEADDDGAHVHALGEDIDAKSGGDATVGGSWNGVSNTIHARHDHVEMRIGFSGRNAVDQTFLLQSDHPGPSGDRLVGYVARGPAAGPLVVASVEAALPGATRRDADLNDLKALVAANVKS